MTFGRRPELGLDEAVARARRWRVDTNDRGGRDEETMATAAAGAQGPQGWGGRIRQLIPPPPPDPCTVIMNVAGSSHLELGIHQRRWSRRRRWCIKAEKTKRRWRRRGRRTLAHQPLPSPSLPLSPSPRTRWCCHSPHAPSVVFLNIPTNPLVPLCTHAPLAAIVRARTCRAACLCPLVV